MTTPQPEILARRDGEAIESGIMRMLDKIGIAHRIQPPGSMMAHGNEGTIHVMAKPWLPSPEDVARLDRAGAYVEIRDGMIVVTYAIGPGFLWPHARFLPKTEAFET